MHTVPATARSLAHPDVPVEVKDTVMVCLRVVWILRPSRAWWCPLQFDLLLCSFGVCCPAGDCSWTAGDSPGDLLEFYSPLLASGTTVVTGWVGGSLQKLSHLKARQPPGTMCVPELPVGLREGWTSPGSLLLG